MTSSYRPEARWSDGVPVTASDFLFTQRSFRTFVMPAFDERALYRRIGRARVLDAKTFRIELRAPFAAWRELYRLVLPSHALSAQDLTKVWIDGITNPGTGRPIGSGPFLVQRFERGKQITLVRNARYWGPHTAYLDRYVARFLPHDPRDPLAPLRRNEFDMTLGFGMAFLSAELAREVRQVPGWRVAAGPRSCRGAPGVSARSRGTPGAQERARASGAGLRHRSREIARAILAEADKTSRVPLDSTVFQPTEPFYRSTWSVYRYDPARAQRLLQQAGCRRGSDGVYVCGGERLSLRFATTGGNPVRERTLLLAQAQLRKVGVEVVLTFAPFAVFFGQLLPNGDFDARSSPG